MTGSKAMVASLYTSNEFVYLADFRERELTLHSLRHRGV
jgi:hypothetical protein